MLWKDTHRPYFHYHDLYSFEMTSLQGYYYRGIINVKVWGWAVKMVIVFPNTKMSNIK